MIIFLVLFLFLPLQAGLFDQLLLPSQIMLPLATGDAEYPELQVTENPSAVCPLLEGETLSEFGIVWLPLQVLAGNYWIKLNSDTLARYWA